MLYWIFVIGFAFWVISLYGPEEIKPKDKELTPETRQQLFNEIMRDGMSPEQYAFHQHLLSLQDRR